MSFKLDKEPEFKILHKWLISENNTYCASKNFQVLYPNLNDLLSDITEKSLPQTLGFLPLETAFLLWANL